jgi:NitT/TauT family transport system ATP-binding protein
MFSVQNLTFKRAGDEIYLFHNFSLDFGNEVTFLVGKNGVGKTSLLDCISEAYLLHKINKQSSVVFGAATRLDFITQKPHHSSLQWYSAKKNLQIICKINNRDVDFELFEQRLRIFGVNPSVNVNKLSGGQMQIVNILKSISLNPDVLIMDEAFAALDVQNSIKLEKLIIDWQKSTQSTVVMVSHSIDDIYEMADRVIFLEGTPVRVCGDVTKSEISSPGNKIIRNFFEYETV